MPFASVWFAIDLGTGLWSVATPEGFPQLQLPIPEIVAAKLELTLSMAEVVVVRPGVGAWGETAGDGGEADEDGEQNLVTRVGPAGMWTIGSGPPPPDEIALTDVVAVIEPDELAFTAGRPAEFGESQ